jgi:hypothetical protein
VVDGDAALGHHLLKVSQAQIVGQILPDAEQDDRSIKLPTLEHCVLPHCGLDAIVETLKQKVCDTSSAAGSAWRHVAIGRRLPDVARGPRGKSKRLAPFNNWKVARATDLILLDAGRAPRQFATETRRVRAPPEMPRSAITASRFRRLRL